MASQIDATKPTTVQPRFSDVRANFAAAKAEIGQLGEALAAITQPDWADITGKPAIIAGFVVNNQMGGTTPTLVGSIQLPAGAYPPPSAQIGCGNPAFAATLECRKPDGTVLATIGGEAGGVQWRSAAAGFVLAETTPVDFLLYTSTIFEPAFISGFTF